MSYSTIMNGILIVFSAIPYGTTLTVGAKVGINFGANSLNKARRYAFSEIIYVCVISLMIWTISVVLKKNFKFVYVKKLSNKNCLASYIDCLKLSIYSFINSVSLKL